MRVGSAIQMGHMEIAETASDALIAQGLVDAACLLGSASRRTERPDSDVDLLLITQPRLYHSELFKALPSGLQDARLSLIPRTREAWLRAVDRGSLFVLHARLEGTILRDPNDWLTRTFERAADVPPDVAGELQRQRRRLRVLRDIDRFNGRFLFVLSDLFSIGKASAIAHCVAHGEPIFVKQRALARLAELRPDLAHHARVVAQLEPFYQRARGRVTAVPFHHDDATGHVHRAIDAVAALSRG